MRDGRVGSGGLRGRGRSGGGGVGGGLSGIDHLAVGVGVAVGT